MSLWGWWFSEKNPIYRGGQRVGQRAYETGYSTGRLITGQTPPPSYPGGEYQDTTPASEYAEQYGGAPPSGGEGAGAAESAEARRRRERREEQQRREEERRRNVMVIPTVTVGLGGGVGAITPVISKLFSPIIRAGEFVGAEAKRAGEWAAGYDAYSRAAAVMLPSYEAQLEHYEAQGEQYTQSLGAAKRGQEQNLVTARTGEVTFETEEWRSFQKKWSPYIRGTTFLGTHEQYGVYMAEFEQAKVREQTAFAEYEQSFAPLQAQYASLQSQYQSLQHEYGTFEQLEAGAKVKQQERWWGLPMAQAQASTWLKEHLPTEERLFSPIEQQQITTGDTTYRLAPGGMAIQIIPGGGEGGRGKGFIEQYLKVGAGQDIFTQHQRGMYSGFLEKPITTAATYAAFVALPTVLAEANILATTARLVPKGMGGVLPEAVKYVPRIAGYALGGLYATSIGTRLYAEPPEMRIRKFGEITSTELVPMAAGTYTGMQLQPYISGYIHTVGKEYIPLETIGVEEGYPIRPGLTERQVTASFTESTLKVPPTAYKRGGTSIPRSEWPTYPESARLPGEMPGEIYGWHAIPKTYPPEMGVPIGTSELPGMFHSPIFEAYFAKVGPVEQIRLFGMGFTPSIPSGVRMHVKGIAPIPSGIRAAGYETMAGYITTPKHLGYFWEPLMKPEYEAVLPAGTKVTQLKSKFFTKIGHVRVPLFQYEVAGAGAAGVPAGTALRPYYEYAKPRALPLITPYSAALAEYPEAPPSYPSSKPSLPASYPVSYPPSYPSSYPSSYPPSYPTSYPSSYPPPYPSSRPVSYAPSYPPSYPSSYPPSYPGSYPPSYPASYPPSYPKPYLPSYPPSYPPSQPPYYPPPPPPPPTMLYFEKEERKIKKKKRRKEWEWKETWQVPTPQQLIGNVPGVIKAGPGIPTVSQAQMLNRLPKDIYKRRGY